MILHSVYCNVLADVEPADVKGLFAELERLCDGLEGAVSFEGGPNRDFEQKSPGFAYGFVIRFTDADALSRYAVHPKHQQLGARLCTLCKGGADGIMVFDLEV